MQKVMPPVESNFFTKQAAMPSASSRPTIRKENCDAVIRVYDESGNVIETHEHAGDFKQP